MENVLACRVTIVYQRPVMNLFLKRKETPHRNEKMTIRSLKMIK